MTITDIKKQIHQVEVRLNTDRQQYVMRRDIFKTRSQKFSNLIFLLPIAGFILGWRGEKTTVQAASRFAKQHAINWAQILLKTAILYV